MRDVERAARPVSLMLILGCLGATLILGSALKGPCANGSWGDGRQYRLFCYSDIVPLLNSFIAAEKEKTEWLEVDPGR